MGAPPRKVLANTSTEKISQFGEMATPAAGGMDVQPPAVHTEVRVLTRKSGSYYLCAGGWSQVIEARWCRGQVMKPTTPRELLVTFGGPAVYDALFVQQTGQTIAKSPFGLDVVDREGRPLDDGARWLRAGVKAGQWLLCCIPLCAVLLSVQRVALHDLAAGTRVVRALPRSLWR